jgi:glycosyltransferase involved in cell wall biosynthesis
MDVTPFVGARTGIGRSVEEMYRALDATVEDVAIVPYALGARTHRLRDGLPAGTRIVTLPTRALLFAWSHTSIPPIDPWVRGADVVHATNYVAPPTRRPLLVTVNDCSFVHYPETVTREVLTFEAILRRAAKRGAWFHCTTNAIAQEVDELFGPGLLDEGRIAVVPFAFPALGPATPMPAELAARVGDGPYVLALGTLEPRKNIARLVSAFGAVADAHPDVRLVIAGRDDTARPSIDAATDALAPTARSRVVLTGSVPDDGRRALLEGASVLAYPSIYEGFGFPVLEAMSVGVPVLAADVPAIAEVAAGAARLATPTSVDALAAGLAEVLDDAAGRERLVAAGRARVAQLSWEATARGLARTYASLYARARTSS